MVLRVGAGTFSNRLSIWDEVLIKKVRTIEMFNFGVNYNVDLWQIVEDLTFSKFLEGKGPRCQKGSGFDANNT